MSREIVNIKGVSVTSNFTWKNSIGTSVVSGILIILFIIFEIYPIPCNSESLGLTLINTLNHVNYIHLITNLAAFIVLWPEEIKIKTNWFLLLVLSLIILTSLTEWGISLLRHNERCAVGFSGVIYALIAFFICQQTQFNWSILIALIIPLAPALFTPGIAWESHLIGFTVGFIIGLITRVVC